VHSMKVADNIVFLATINHFTTRARLRDIREMGFGIVEFCLFDNPPANTGWPSSGFQLVAGWLARGYTGPTHWTTPEHTIVRLAPGAPSNGRIEDERDS
jgi:hypothetical protein